MCRRARCFDSCDTLNCWWFLLPRPFAVSHSFVHRTSWKQRTMDLMALHHYDPVRLFPLCIDCMTQAAASEGWSGFLRVALSVFPTLTVS